MTNPFDQLTALLARLPGIGEKSAMRLALALVASDAKFTSALADSIRDVVTSMRSCSVCCDLTVDEVCSICSDAKRDPKVICVVTRTQDRIALEKAAVFRGRYHVLGGVLDPLAGVMPSDLNVRELLSRLRDEVVTEVIVATSPTAEGDATALYLAQLIGPSGVTVTRIASGVAVGGDLEYADMVTLARALAERRSLAE